MLYLKRLIESGFVKMASTLATLRSISLTQMSKTQIQLQDCPFCGGPAKTQHKHYKANYQGMRTSFTGLMNIPARTIWFAGCWNNDCEIAPKTRWQMTKDDAVKIWNTRILNKEKHDNSSRF